MATPYQAAGLEPSRPARALPDREDLRNLEAQLRTTTHALAGTGESGLAVRLTAITYNLKRTAVILMPETA
jgi:hypothetical protein